VATTSTLIFLSEPVGIVKIIGMGITLSSPTLGIGSYQKHNFHNEKILKQIKTDLKGI
jgi:hypothetical protein